VYLKSGTFTVTLAVNGDHSHIASKPITIKSYLNISLSGDYIVGDTTFFSGSGGPKGATYILDFGDGATVSSTLGNQAHVYTTTGTFNPSLRISSDPTIVYVPIVIRNYDIATNAHLCVTQPINFSSNAPAGSTYYWDFGDLSYSSGPTPSHTYAAEGNYTVSLVVNGRSAFPSKKTLSIGKYPTATSRIAGMKNWRKGQIQDLATGYPSYLRWPPAYSGDTSFSFTYIDDFTIAFGNDTLPFVNISGNFINFSRASFYDSLSFDYVNNTINYIKFNSSHGNPPGHATSYLWDVYSTP
jgi:hypothetical protein